MLQLIHNFKKTFMALVFLFLAGVSLATMGIGTSHLGDGPVDSQSAATVDGEGISYAELTRARNDGRIPSQQALDNLVDRTVVRRFADRAGLAAGEGAIRQTLQDLAPGGMTPEGLSEMLRSLRMSPLELEKEIQKESVSRQLYSAISAAVQPSEAEITEGLKNLESIRTISLAQLSAESLLPKAAVPSDEAIQRYYAEQTSDFEVPPAISYDYVVFTPERYQDSVIVTDEDVELYYADNEKEFTVPGSVEAKHIRLLYPKDSKPEALVAVKEKAQRAYSRAKAGESFDALVLEFSDDIATKLMAGNLGEVKRGSMGPEFDSAVFKLKTPGLAELIEADYGFQIVQVTAVQPERVKPLDAVKDQIRAKLQKVEAPAYASARAGELFAEWRKVGGTLKEFATGRGLPIASSAALLTAGEDPAASLKGLTRGIISEGGLQPEDAKHQVELTNESVLAEVTGRREATVAELQTVREQIVKILQMREVGNTAREKADALAKADVAEFDKSAKGAGFTVQAGLVIKSQDRNLPAPLAGKPELIAKIGRLSATGVTPAVCVTGVCYVAAVTKVEPDKSVTPEQRNMNKRIMAQQIQYELGGLVEKALLASEKRVAKIEIQPGAYGNE
jgi:parvulin-like peptidyl-prolyl isomerase